MKILDLMNTNPNWMEIIQSAPYNIAIKNDGEYYLLKYNQLSSDFNEEIVRECRGSIFRLDGAEWICVCHPFDKFGNYGEAYCPDIDWETAYVYEKVDGSLMKMWYDHDQWHLSTNGTIDAYKAEMNAWGKTFGEYFEYALEQFYGMTIGMIETFMDKDCTYMFELVGPQNRLVVNYERPCVYFLGVRDRLVGDKEFDPSLDGLSRFIQLPRIYNLTSVEECLEAAAAMSSNEEGFVVCDANFNRIKIKSSEYLLAAHLQNNGVITPRRIIRMMMNDQIDDFLAYCPQYKDDVDKMIAAIKTYMFALRDDKEVARFWFGAPRGEYWNRIKSMTNPDFMMRVYSNHELTANEYIKYQVETFGEDWLLNRLEGYNGS